jgi:hypothetical protein
MSAPSGVAPAAHANLEPRDRIGGKGARDPPAGLARDEPLEHEAVAIERDQSRGHEVGGVRTAGVANAVSRRRRWCGCRHHAGACAEHCDDQQTGEA